jgi:hypothetical protein
MRAEHSSRSPSLAFSHLLSPSHLTPMIAEHSSRGAAWVAFRRARQAGGRCRHTRPHTDITSWSTSKKVHSRRADDSFDQSISSRCVERLPERWKSDRTCSLCSAYRRRNASRSRSCSTRGETPAICANSSARLTRRFGEGRLIQLSTLAHSASGSRRVRTTRAHGYAATAWARSVSLQHHGVSSTASTPRSEAIVGQPCQREIDICRGLRKRVSTEHILRQPSRPSSSPSVLVPVFWKPAPMTSGRTRPSHPLEATLGCAAPRGIEMSETVDPRRATHSREQRNPQIQQ